jgi:hypothetical protein
MDIHFRAKIQLAFRPAGFTSHDCTPPRGNTRDPRHTAVCLPASGIVPCTFGKNLIRRACGAVGGKLVEPPFSRSEVGRRNSGNRTAKYMKIKGTSSPNASTLPLYPIEAYSIFLNVFCSSCNGFFLSKFNGSDHHQHRTPGPGLSRVAYRRVLGLDVPCPSLALREVVGAGLS